MWGSRTADTMDNITLSSSKILLRAPLAAEVARRQASGERGVFTNGCFDLLHLGHVHYLQDARALGDFLVLGLNGDESVAFLKGPGRPLVPAHERAEIHAIVDLLRPAIYVKGGDYAGAQAGEPDLSRLPEAPSVLAYGGLIRLIPYLPGHSTTELIAAIKQLPEKAH